MDSLFVWNQKVHHRIRKIPPLDPVFSQYNVVLLFTLNLCKIIFNIVISSTICLCPGGYLTKILHKSHVSHLSYITDHLFPLIYCRQ